jgi:hypothetical protein
MQGLQWIRSPLAHTCSLLQVSIKVGSFVALLPAISSHTFRGLGGSMQQQEYSSFHCHMQVHLTYDHVFYVKPSMFKTPKLWFHVI